MQKCYKKMVLKICNRLYIKLAMGLTPYLLKSLARVNILQAN
ncbi:hypothetical protein RG47T_3074 [Mucilaginibacter polytrichastri]|uniref:Uncharacterized protein n=1 Tax=Mucilaginibacter polytrichastri TaxID=1302689 RepID=A0A1Q6A0T1_9SPHI|nr:hypothetical protein RG47T_3074 [Mucilaginibacter polytrichastri]